MDAQSQALEDMEAIARDEGPPVVGLEPACPRKSLPPVHRSHEPGRLERAARRGEADGGELPERAFVAPIPTDRQCARGSADNFDADRRASEVVHDDGYHDPESAERRQRPEPRASHHRRHDHRIRQDAAAFAMGLHRSVRGDPRRLGLDERPRVPIPH